MKEIASEKILKGIFDNDRSIIQFVYDKYFNTIKSYVIKYGGSKEDAWDIFQDGIVIIYEQIKNEDLEIKSSFITYFFTVCKYQWLKTVRQNSNKYFEVIEESKDVERLHHQEHTIKLDEVIENEKRNKLYHVSFLKLSKECQYLLKLVAKGFSVKELAEALNYKSTGFTYKKRRICKQRLTKLIEIEQGNQL